MNREWLKLSIPLTLLAVAPLVFLYLCGAVLAGESDAVQANLVIEGLRADNSLLWKLGTIIVGAETATIVFLMRNWMADKAKLIEKIEASKAEIVKLLRERLGEKGD